MKQAFLLDANLLIGAFDGDAENPAHVQAKAKLQELLGDENVSLAISPLIRYEILRGCKNEWLAIQLAERLDGFEEFEINAAIGQLAARIFRFDRQEKKILDKRQFDVLHFSTAKVYKLAFDSQDGDVMKINEIFKKMEGN